MHMKYEKGPTIVGGSVLYKNVMHMKGLMRQKYEIFRVQNNLDLQYTAHAALLDT